MSNKSLPLVGLSCGDPNGIGIEIILKTLSDKRNLKLFTPVLFCNEQLLTDQMKHFDLELDFIKLKNKSIPVNGKVNVVDVLEKPFKTNFGEQCSESGNISYLSLKEAVYWLSKSKIDVLVTAPINKNNIQNENFDFPGHTDYLAKILEGESLMFMISDGLKVGLITDHIPIKNIHSSINKELIMLKHSILKNSLIKDFKIQKPKIAFLSIDPHVGDGGIIGNDDKDILKPSLIEISKTGDLVFGPFSSDSFFGSGSYKKYDAVLAIYHDQGLIPFKTLSFGEGVNYTAGLDKIRTSPDHGTGYDIAGKGIADSSSFKKAIYSAIDIFNSRKLYEKLKPNSQPISGSKRSSK